MMKKILFTLMLLMSLPTFAEPITSGGEQLKNLLDSMDVEHKWLRNHNVNWWTGESYGVQKRTYCSSFAAAVAYRLNIYLLRPPEHSQVLLANAQYDWLQQKAKQGEWAKLPNGQVAQHLANQGCLVLASLKNPDPNRPGHIVVIRPSEKSAKKIKQEGPEITQAGKNNYTDTYLQNGFVNHPDAFKNNQISFFAHTTQWCSAIPA